MGDGGWMIESAEDVVEGFESRPPALWLLAPIVGREFAV